ncbi:hypothetical protein J6590_077527 [Homalodisca vitripennis]|nr:hypothetical protein J6590_077527 [Homalodisca vitripennis]
MALLCRSRQSGQNADMEAYKAAKRTYRKALQVARRVSNEECINTVDNKCKATWTIVNCETGRDRPSHHVQPNAEDFNKYCISAVDEIRQNLSLLSSSAATQYPGPFPALQLASSDWWCYFTISGLCRSCATVSISSLSVPQHRHGKFCYQYNSTDTVSSAISTTAPTL